MSYASSGTVSSYSSQPTVPSSAYPSNSYSQASAGVAYQAGPASYPSISQCVNSYPSGTPSYQTTGQSVYGGSALGGSVSYAGSTGTGQYQNNYGGGIATTSQNHTKLSSALNTGTKEAQVKEGLNFPFDEFYSRYFPSPLLFSFPSPLPAVDFLYRNITCSLIKVWGVWSIGHIFCN